MEPTKRPFTRDTRPAPGVLSYNEWVRQGRPQSRHTPSSRPQPADTPRPPAPPPAAAAVNPVGTASQEWEDAAPALRPTGRGFQRRAVNLAPYDYLGILGAEFVMLCIWGSLWLLNGYFTVVFVQTCGTLLLGMSVSWLIGAALHLVISFIEQHLWKSGDWFDYLWVFAIGLVDVFSTAAGLLFVLLSRGWATTSLPWTVGVTVVALGIALIPERRGVKHAQVIWRMVHGR